MFDKFIGKSIIKNASILLAEMKVGVDEYLDLDMTINKDKIVILSPPFETDEYLNIPKKADFRKNTIFLQTKTLLAFKGECTILKAMIF